MNLTRMIIGEYMARKPSKIEEKATEETDKAKSSDTDSADRSSAKKSKGENHSHSCC